MSLSRLLLLPLLGALSACVSEPEAEPYAFVGLWDCQVATFTFTNTTYNNGSETFRIRSVAQDGKNYTLFMEGGFRIGLGLVIDTGMTWVSGTTGDQFNCRRLK